MRRPLRGSPAQIPGGWSRAQLVARVLAMAGADDVAQIGLVLEGI
jgi:hypothetical protein